MSSFFPDLPEEAIRAALMRMPGNEIKTGKFDGPESSAALTANAFGRFIEQPGDLPPLPRVPAGQASKVALCVEMNLPWSGGKHPWLDVGIETPTTLIGIRAARYEPFRPLKRNDFAEIKDRPVWFEKMAGYTQLRKDMTKGKLTFETLDAAQLIKDAYGLFTRAQKQARGAVLVYLYAEPKTWASGKPLSAARITLHRREIKQFATAVLGDGVVFVPLPWAELLKAWGKDAALAGHVAALRDRFGVLG